ncbi:MAG: rod shape-determining protein [Oscillospiraceae bacterium]|nr:rod shape-determining protein [Oscillospiraceae bacterium]MDD4413068.1 rod shape-determining protein [Oscillospiraceae bacterium]
MPGMSLGIDLGTSRVTIYVPGHGVVLREPSVIAVDKKTDRMIACGQEAFEMLGRTPDSIVAMKPLTKGVISEYDYAEKMLRTFVRRVCAYKVIKPRVAVSIPATVTEVEQRSLVEAVLAAGTRRVLLIDEAVAAAVGAGIQIDLPQGSMIVNIGAGTTNIAVLSLKGIASSLSVRVGGDDIDEAIVRFLHNRHNHVIGLQTAEQVKFELGNAVPPEENSTMQIKGRNVVSGLPCLQEVNANQIFEAIAEPVGEILHSIQRVLESTPPELAGDIMNSGICLTGGCSKLKGMADAVSRFTGVDCRVADNPSDCVAIGTGKSLKFAGNMFSGVFDVGQFSYPLSDSARL